MNPFKLFQIKRSAWYWQDLMPDPAIYDADGWRLGDGVDMRTPITRREYLRRRNLCTVIYRNKPQPKWSLRRWINKLRTERLINSDTGRYCIKFANYLGYDLIREECTPQELVFRKGDQEIRLK